MMQLLSLKHCFVGLDKAFKTLSLNSTSFLLSVLIFFEISSAVFSALLFVFAKTKPCFPIFIVSRAKSRAPFPVSEEIFLLGIKKRKNQEFYKFVVLNNQNIPDFRNTLQAIAYNNLNFFLSST